MKNPVMLILILAGMAGSALSAHAGKTAQSAQGYFDAGQEAARQKNFRKAVEFYEQAIETDPDFAPAYRALGLVLMEEEGSSPQDIIWLFKQAVALEPEDVEAYSQLCRACYKAGDHDGAEQACLRALAIDPAYGGAALSLAWVYLMGKSQPGRAIPYFKSVLVRVKNPQVYYGLGVAYARSGDGAGVLDTVTTLRGMGEEALASQLEQMIRPGGPPVIPDTGASPDVPPSTIIKAKPDHPPAAAAPSASAPGAMKVRLRGTLTPLNPAPSGSAATGPSGDSPYSPPEMSAQERIEQLRRIRGSRIYGQGTTTLQPRPSENP